MKEYISGILILATVMPATVLAADDGESWNITIKTEMPGMPMPEISQTVCLPRGEAYIPEKVPHQKHCKISEVKVSGNRTTWKIHCSDREAVHGNGVVNRTAKTMKGTVDLSSQNIQMTQTISGKRVGACQSIQ